jgi:ABC-type transport system involved in multi-copper enzyme maturation permease subunit
MVIICYYMIGLNPPFSDYLLVATLAAFSALCGNTYGTLIVACVDDLGIALTIAPLCILPLLVVSGIFVAALPVYINWLKYISPIYYAFSGMIQTEFSRTFPNCDPTAEVCNGSRAIEELNFAATFPPGVDIVFLATIFAVLWVLGFIALYIGAKRKQ